MDQGDDDSTVNGAATPPTTVWGASDDGNDLDVEIRETVAPVQPQIPHHIAPNQPIPAPSRFRVWVEQMNAILQVLKGGVDWFGRFLVVLLVVFGVYSIWIHLGQPSSSPLYHVGQFVTKIVCSTDPSPCESLSIPLPNYNYIIRSLSSGKVLDSRNGQVILAKSRSKDSSHWECVQTNGWLGFRDTQFPHAYLGHDISLNLQVEAASQKGWENFVLRPIPSGGFMLLMVHSVFLQPDVLWHVGMQGGQLAKMGAEGGIAWEFIEV